MKTPIKIKDHFLSKETFIVSDYKPGVLKTEPGLNSKELQKYYNSDKYLSHSKSSSFFGKISFTSSNIFSTPGPYIINSQYSLFFSHFDFISLS